MERDMSLYIRCPDCGETRSLGIRQLRRAKNQNVDPRCSVCRSIKSPAVIEQKHRNFWTNQYSSEWIKETAEMIWGDDPS
jgi:phage terminase large subunit GpA-like protein